MPFTAMAIAALGATVGTALRQKKREKKQDSIMAEQLAQQQARQAQFDALGRPLFDQGKGNMDLVQQYLRSLASGDRNLTMQTMAPQINTMSDTYRGSVAAQRSLSPRGGTTAANAADLPRQHQSDINNMLFGVRPEAMNQLGQLGSNQASLGLGAMGQGAGLTNSMLQYGLESRRQMLEQGMALGQGIGGMAQLLMQYQMGRTPAANTSQPLSPFTAQQAPNLFNSPTQGWGSSSLGFGNSSPYSNYGIYSMGRST